MKNTVIDSGNRIRHILFNQATDDSGVMGKVLPGPCLKVVQDIDPMPFGQEPSHQVKPDEPGTSCHKIGLGA
jgi:hypothetical protein